MRVLVGTDGSSDAKAAVEWMACLPLPPDREVMVVTVVEPPRRFGVLRDGSEDLPTALIAEARRVADDTASRLLRGRKSTGRVVEGDPCDQIVAVAGTWDADLIVLGARGLGAIKELLLGSVSLGVVRQAPCPVLVCKGPPRTVRTVTVALDGSEPARQALGWIARLPLASTLRVQLVGVAIDAEHRARLETELAAAARMASARGAGVTVTVATGEPSEHILQEAERTGSDLVVVGARGVGAATRLLLGSVSESVLRRASCPVLVVRPSPSSGA